MIPNLGGGWAWEEVTLHLESLTPYPSKLCSFGRVTALLFGCCSEQRGPPAVLRTVASDHGELCPRLRNPPYDILSRKSACQEDPRRDTAGCVQCCRAATVSREGRGIDRTHQRRVQDCLASSAGSMAHAQFIPNFVWYRGGGQTNSTLSITVISELRLNVVGDTRGVGGRPPRLYSLPGPSAWSRFPRSSQKFHDQVGSRITFHTHVSPILFLTSLIFTFFNLMGFLKG